MMKNLHTLILVTLFFSLKTFGQFSNSWINQSKSYAKVTVKNTGIYEMPVSNIAPFIPGLIGSPSSSLAMFFRGQPAAFELVSSGTIQGSDIIRFYGIKNNGDLERELYRPITAIPNIHSSLFTPESQYFFVLEPTAAKRITAESAVAGLGTYDVQTIRNVRNFTSDFSFNSTTGPIPLVQMSFFERGEGYTGPQISGGVTKIFKISCKGITDPNVTVEVVINGRDTNNRIVTVKAGSEAKTPSLFGFDHQLVTLNTTVSLPLSEDSLAIELSSTLDRFSVSSIRVKYKGKAVMESNSTATFSLAAGDNTGILNLTEFSGGAGKLFNITDQYAVKAVSNGASSSQFLTQPAVPGMENTYFHSNSMSTPVSIHGFSPSSLVLNNSADYLIISHKNLQTSANQYKAFRESVEGGNHTVELVYIDDLVNNFNYGIQTPLAIKNYLRKKLVEGQPKNLLLLGKAFSAYTGTNKSEDLVPSIGYPASDLLLSSGIITHQDVFGIATGRIPALTDEEVMNYLQKVKDALNYPQTLDQKNVFSFNGGKTLSEIGNFGNIMDNLSSIALSSDYGVNLVSRRKTTAVAREEANLGPVVNAGQAFMGYFGHSSYTFIDYNIGYATDAALGFNNKRFPIFYFNGCAYNNYFREIKTQSHDWMFAPNKGALGIVGQSYYGYESALVKHGIQFYETVFKSTTQPTVGEALKVASQKVVSKSNFTAIDVLNNDQTLFFGDPAIKIFNYSKPDFLLEPNSVSQSLSGNERTIKVKYCNIGKSTSSLRIRVFEEGLTSSLEKIVTIDNPKSKDEVSIVMTNIPFLTKIRVELDDQNTILEENENNNSQVIVADEAANGPRANDDSKSLYNPSELGTVFVLQNDILSNSVPASSSNASIDLNPLTTDIDAVFEVANEGTWRVANGEVSFQPNAGFFKDPTPIYYYLIENGTGLKSVAKVSFDYKPVAVSNSDKYTSGSTKTINIIDNDNTGDVPVPSTLKFEGTSTPGQSIFVNGQGTWTLNLTNGEAIFTPLSSFQGDPTPIGYTVKDKQGNTSNVATIILDALPIATNDSYGYQLGTSVVLHVLMNDNKGDAINPSTLSFVGNPNESANGTWTINSEYALVYTPTDEDSPLPAPIYYQVSDYQGNISNIDTVKLDDFPPIAKNDFVVYSSNSIKTVNVLSNDILGDAAVSVFLIDADDDSNGKKKTATGEGTWEVLSSNEIRFTPFGFFGGSPHFIYYYTRDAQGTPSNSATVTLSEILPLTLEYFKGQLVTEGNKLSWKAKSERGFSHFELLKSTDLKEFGLVAKIPGSSLNGKYEFVDTEQINGLHYYQLRMVDQDGSLSYSKIVSLINNEKKSTSIVYPNPSTDFRFYIKDVKNIDEVHVFDSKGNIIKSSFNKNIMRLDINSATPGVYLVKIQSGANQFYRKVSVLN